MNRKDFLRNSAGIATLFPLLSACQKSSVDPVSTSTSTGTTTGTTTSSTGCIVTPTGEEGPFPYPSGELKNPLNRTDVTAGQTGIPLTLTMQVVNTNANCAAIAGARVDIWACNKDGYYSGYSQSGVLGQQNLVGQTWLRGYQLADASGNLQFTTIYPGWYQGRATHIHVEVFIDNILKKQAQLAFPETISDAVHVTSLYKAHGINTTRNANDHVFSSLDKQLVTINGDLTKGYLASYVIGIAL